MSERIDPFLNPQLIGPLTHELIAMLFLLFQLGKDRYALDAASVAEVLPLLDLKSVPHAPRGIAGLFNYHGTIVPAVDLSELALGRPSTRKLSTRILLVNSADDSGKKHLLGLIAEHATETVRRRRDDFTEPGLKLARAPFLGPTLTDEHGIVRLVDEQKLLPDSIREFLQNPKPNVQS